MPQLQRSALCVLAGIAIGLVPYSLHVLQTRDQDLEGSSVAPAAATLPPAVTRPQTRSVTLSTSADIGPQPVPRSVEEILEIPGDFGQTVALYQLAATADEVRLIGLLDEAERIDRFSDRSAAMMILYERYAELNPVGMLVDIRQRGGADLTFRLGTLFHSWARTDIEAAVEAAEGLDPLERMAALNAILRSRDDFDVATMQAYAERLGMPQLVDHHLNQRQVRRAAENPGAAWQNALGEPPGRRQRALMGVAAAWARSDPYGALEAIRALPPGQDKDRLWQRVAFSWSTQDPEGALDWVLSQPEQHIQATAVVASALGTIARGNPRRAWERAQALDPRYREAAQSAVLQNWANSDPRAAANHALGLDTRTGGVNRALPAIAQALARSAPQEAVDWAREIGSAGAMRAAINQVARRSPAQARRLVEDLPRSQERTAAMGTLIGSLTNSDPATAAALLDELPAGDTRNRSYMLVARAWSQRDPGAAERFADDAPTGGPRDAALTGLLLNQGLPPADADQLFEEIQGPDQRRQAAAALANRFANAGDDQRAERFREIAGVAADRSTATMTTSVRTVPAEFIGNGIPILTQ